MTDRPGPLPKRAAKLVAAFDKGRAAADADKPRRSCPFDLVSQRDKWDAWQAGYDDAAGPSYTAAKAPR